MDDDFDEFEEEVEDFEEEEKVKAKKPVKKKPVVKETQEPEERYVAFYQPLKIGIVDTLSQEIIIDGLSDYSVAQLEAFKLNQLDKIGTASGAQ